MLRFRSYALVDSIARSGSIAGAAILLDMTQSAVTKALMALESEIGAKLFSAAPSLWNQRLLPIFS